MFLKGYPPVDVTISIHIGSWRRRVSTGYGATINWFVYILFTGTNRKIVLNVIRYGRVKLFLESSLVCMLKLLYKPPYVF